MLTGPTAKHPLTVRAWTPGQQPTTLDCCVTQVSVQFLLSPMERRHLRECRPGQPTAGQTYSRKVPAVTKPALSHNATKTQSSCPQRSGKTLELSQRWLEAFLPSHRWIHWEVATFGHKTLRRHSKNFVRACYPRSNNASHVPCWDKACETLNCFLRPRPSIVSSVQDPVGLTLMETLRPYFFD